MRPFGLAVFLLAFGTPVPALTAPHEEVRPRVKAAERSERPTDSLDTILNAAAAVAPARTVRATTRFGADRSPTGGTLPTVDAGLVWSLGRGIATDVVARVRDHVADPEVGIRWQWLRQSVAGIDAIAAIRYGNFGYELAGAGIGGELALGRRFGPARLTLDALVVRGIGVRTDVDAVFGGAAMFDLTERWVLGVDARARTELLDDYETSEDMGRPFDVTVGLVGARRYGAVYIQFLGGVRFPRGFAAPGALGILAGTVSF